MKLGKVRSYLLDAKSYEFSDRNIIAIVRDSRRVNPEHLFVAIKGHNVDGHNFVMNAVERGAVAVVTEKKLDLPSSITQLVVSDTRKALSTLSHHFYGEPSSKITVTGITGTNGKTTTSYLTKSIIESAGEQAGLIGTILYQINQRVISSVETTPESVELHAFLAEMLNFDIKYAVMEVSSHALVQQRTEDINFRTAVFTNLSREHLDYHRTVTAYRDAKARLFEGLNQQSFAILNADEPDSKYFASRTRAKIVWYGMKNEAEVTAKIIFRTTNNTEFRLRCPKGEVIISLQLIGDHNVYNALAAAANALSLGFDLETIKKGIEAVSSVRGRLEAVECGQKFRVFIDFAHTPDALQTVLTTLRPLTKGRVIVVFGCGGNRDREKRPKMGHIAEKYSDLFWITSDNPRSEDPISIINEVEAGITSGCYYHTQPDRRLAIEEALSEAEKGDTVLIAGKGHERSQIFNGTVIPFDDRDVVKKILLQRPVLFVSFNSKVEPTAQKINI
ncbi:MAG: UDP-N-acetylmuramoyl-L-alanyl-D-glutamate--2,6-diaminopimelate ligase [Candidatus Brocadiales bacterium]